MKLGDTVAAAIALIPGIKLLPCYGADGELIKGTPCDRRRALLNGELVVCAHWTAGSCSLLLGAAPDVRCQRCAVNTAPNYWPKPRTDCKSCGKH